MYFEAKDLLFLEGTRGYSFQVEFVIPSRFDTLIFETTRCCSLRFHKLIDSVYFETTRGWTINFEATRGSSFQVDLGISGRWKIFLEDT